MSVPLPTCSSLPTWGNRLFASREGKVLTKPTHGESSPRGEIAGTFSRRATAIGLIATACSTEAGQESVPADPFRVVFFSDTHVIGPQYECCSESEGLDNESIMKTPDRLSATVARVNAMDPPADYVFVIGDILHDAYHSSDLAWYRAEESAWSRAAAMMSELKAPYKLVLGNHDYSIGCDEPDSPYTRDFTAELFSEHFSTEPYWSVEQQGWRFIGANAMLGPTWESGNPMCDTGKASYGREQLAWMAAEFDKGQPTVWLSHYMLPIITQANEDPGGPFPDVYSVFAGRDNMRLALVGHTHRWLEFDGTYDFPLYVVASTRYDDDNFWVIDFAPDGSYTIPDRDKAGWFTTCATTWTYNGSPTLDPDGVENGDCGP